MRMLKLFRLLILSISIISSVSALNVPLANKNWLQLGLIATNEIAVMNGGISCAEDLVFVGYRGKYEDDYPFLMRCGLTKNEEILCLGEDTNITMSNDSVKNIKSLKKGDFLKGYTKDSRFITYLHKTSHNKKNTISRINLSNHKYLSISDLHYIFVSTEIQIFDSFYCSPLYVKIVGILNVEKDRLLDVKAKKLVKIDSIQVITTTEGLFAPLSECGELIANDILVHSFSKFKNAGINRMTSMIKKFDIIDSIPYSDIFFYYVVKFMDQIGLFQEVNYEHHSFLEILRQIKLYKFL